MASAVRLVLAGSVYVPPVLPGGGAQNLFETLPGPATSGGSPAPVPESLRDKLTQRQMDVLRLLSQGKSNKQIARELDISEGTVKIHLAAIFRVLNARNRTEAVLAAQQITGAA
jgi:DNA-binding NarL/FixJ family response regulator